MENLDNALSNITKLRIQMVKEGRNDVERSLYDIEIFLVKALDDFTRYKNPGSMPELGELKARRKKMKLSLRDVAINTGVPAATIWRMEKGANVEYQSVKAVHEWYEKQKKLI